jgi:hypothetical protein
MKRLHAASVVTGLARAMLRHHRGAEILFGKICGGAAMRARRL